MSNRIKPLVFRGNWVWAIFLLAACSAPGGPEAYPGTEFPTGAAGTQGTGPMTDGGVDGIIKVTTPLTCTPTASSEPMPARSTVPTGSGSGQSSSGLGNTYFTSMLYEDFRVNCGSCHVDEPSGGFFVNSNTFARVVDQHAVDQITSGAMPPASEIIDFSQRSPSDPVVVLAAKLQRWIDEGRPTTSFTLSDSPDVSDTPSAGDYALPPQLGDALTNIGSCVPSGTVGQNENTMSALDDKFASATALPDTLGETDLTTLDSMELAANGVISYAPTYPLWSDGSGKMRFLRLPRGQHITFDKATQQFHIPDNTRFYKVFLKKVIDANGNERYRKIETRMIIARSDVEPPAGSSASPTITALFGTYVWNDDETNATLLKDPTRDGKPFRDKLISYFTDEMKAQSIIDSHPDDLELALNNEPGLVRHYALPGRERCIDCHMGSANRDFILGFLPLQINRRAPDTGGTYETATGDELTQLQRLIDYGVITGINSPSDILPLEQSEGTRTPRNDQELAAQAYMLGNCSHCHNPRGFPTRKAPALKDLLNFLPSETGGIFQFPLDRVSPLRMRGQGQNVPIPYITPSLRDYPAPYANAAGGYTLENVKWLVCPDPSMEGCKNAAPPPALPPLIDAPWRSLIYRNVDSPFDYVEDFTIFPHMPMHGTGFDCRAPRIMADWMVSIPAVKIHADQLENVVWDKLHRYPPNNDFPDSQTNYDPQPYVEVKPNDPGYADAVSVAQSRLNRYHSGLRYPYCPDTSDILDPAIANEVANNQPVEPPKDPLPDPKDPASYVLPYMGVPWRAHFVPYDPTDPPGAWNPRRADWSGPILQGQVGDESGLSTDDDKRTLENVIASLQQVTVTAAARTALTTKVPFGIWKPKTGCNLGAYPTAGSFTGDSRPRWMDVAGVSAGAAVYSMTPGEAVFNTVCFNCHGPEADADGLLADEIGIMTGGDARVANFRDGILGPRSTPGMNRQPIFVDPSNKLTSDDISARYFAFMALGGTLKHLPETLLGLVSNTPVLGELRYSRKINPEGSPDMLKLALELCLHALPAHKNVGNISLDNFFQKAWIDWGATTALIDKNGDAEMWLRMCALGNRPVVRVATTSTWSADTKPGDIALNGLGLYWGDAYPSTAPVMDHRGRVSNGIHGPYAGTPSTTPEQENLLPLCVRIPDDSAQAAYANQFLQAHPVGGAGGNVIPACPKQLFDLDSQASAPKYQLKAVWNQSAGDYDYLEAQQWAARGAINAGMAVFLYLDQLERGQISVPTPYDQCDRLPTAKGTNP
jgi:mono/diheme cytochrome c family protein